MKKIILSLIALLILVAPGFAADRMCQAKHLHKEIHYQKIWCTKHNGICEKRLFDGTRVDCLTKEYAVEVDFAEKWAESIGQSLYYAHITKKKPAVLLIMEDWKKDFPFLYRLQTLAPIYHITIFIYCADIDYWWCIPY